MKRIKAVVLSLAVLFALSGFALAKDNNHDRDDRGKGSAQQAYQRGYQAGQQAGRDDRDHHRNSNAKGNDEIAAIPNLTARAASTKKGYREGYQSGYNQNYNSQNRDWNRDGDRNRNGDNGGDWNRNGNNNNDTAYRTGYQDGMNEGSKDRSGGHSYRPHSHDETYGNADNNNYSQAGGDKNAYKQRYRQGFEPGL